MKDYRFGNFICALRTELGLSQFQLGALVGVSDKAVSKWENGDAKPRIGTCHRLAAVLGVSIDELLSCEQEIISPARKELEKMNSELWKEAYRRLSVYGEHPPAICLSRLASEEAALCGTDAVQSFALLGRLQEEARKKNTIILASGAVNDSFAAWLFGGTFVHPLSAHYRCPSCGNTLFAPDAGDGFDLSPRNCACGSPMVRDGHDLPFQDYAKSVQHGVSVEIRVSSRFLPHAAGVLKTFYDGVAEVLPVRISSGSDDTHIDRYIILSGNKAKPALSEDGVWHCTWEEWRQWRSGETSYLFIPSRQLDALDEQAERGEITAPDPMAAMTPQTFQALYQAQCRQFPQIAKLAPAEKACGFDLLVHMVSLAHASFTREQWDLLPALPLRHIPASREDIWKAVSAALYAHGVRDDGFALLVMENARKGLYHKEKIPAQHRELLLHLGLPGWYPAYLENVLYLFPKGHCIAHLMIDGLITAAH